MRRATFFIPLFAPLFAQEASALLHPKALPAIGQPAIEELRRNFSDPPAEYRPMPLWVWNDEMTPARMKEMLAQYKRQGLGGAFIHPRPGLITEYLGADWFKLWRGALEEGKRLGLFINIYDENSYPSGFAGGHVPSRAPDTASQYVFAETGLPAKAVSSNPLNVAFFAGPPDDPTRLRRVRSPKEVKEGESVTAFRLRRASGNPWTAGFPYVDLTNPRTAQEFLNTTYEAYKREFGAEFGKMIRWSFTDEPLLATGGAYDSARLALPLSFNTLTEFRRRNGYDLADHIASLYWDTGDFRRVRFDYWQTLHDLWKENFMEPMFAWCDRNGLQFTGHWMEHEWPYPWITPDDASLYAFEHVPGIDMLEGANLRLKGQDPHMLFTIRQVASVAHQLGRRVFCEAYGVAGWDSTFEHYKRFGDWLLVNGVNFVDQHLSFTTVRGARKRDHPQSFSDVSPWWPHYRLHADHLARVSYLSSVSEARQRVLVLQPTTSGFLAARRGADTPELRQMRESNARLHQFLADHQIDYDLGDEYILEWLARVEGKKFKVGRAAYDLLVIPPDLVNFRKQTLPLLESWLAAGGEILVMTDAPAFVDGRESDGVRKLRDAHAKQWVRIFDEGGLIAAIRERLPARIGIKAPIGFMERFLPSGDRILFLTNTTLTPISAKARIQAGSLEEWDTLTGQSNPTAFERTGNTLEFPVELPPAGSVLLLARAAQTVPAPRAEPGWQPLSAPSWTAVPDSANVLVLDYCDLTVSGETIPGINTWLANWTIWQRHGFERPAWDNAVQFRRTILDRNPFPKGSGFRALFRFTVAGAPPNNLRLAVETPELYRITMNGTPVDFIKSQRWLDPHLRSASIDSLAVSGANEIVIEASPFDVRMELENIYILGDFSLYPAEKGFRIGPQKPLMFGSWAKQGRPFYGASAGYTASIRVPSGHTRLRVTLGEWEGSLAEILMDGLHAGYAAWPPYATEVTVKPGPHTLNVKVISTPRNIFGPFHNPSRPRMRAWPAAWAEFPPKQPAGAVYDVLDYGLQAPPALATAP